jgi:hypothetical protein
MSRAIDFDRRLAFAADARIPRIALLKPSFHQIVGLRWRMDSVRVAHARSFDGSPAIRRSCRDGKSDA